MRFVIYQQLSRNKVLRSFELAGRKRIKLDQYVGIIETACGTRIEILPKHIVVGEEQK